MLHDARSTGSSQYCSWWPRRGSGFIETSAGVVNAGRVRPVSSRKGCRAVEAAAAFADCPNRMPVPAASKADSLGRDSGLVGSVIRPETLPKEGAFVSAELPGSGKGRNAGSVRRIGPGTDGVTVDLDRVPGRARACGFRAGGREAGPWATEPTENAPGGSRRFVENPPHTVHSRPARLSPNGWTDSPRTTRSHGRSGGMYVRRVGDSRLGRRCPEARSVATRWRIALTGRCSPRENPADRATVGGWSS